MAASKENLLSLGHIASTDRNTFTKQRAHSSKNRPLRMQSDFSTQQSHQHLRMIQLQQRWQELKDRELTAQQHNRQLLQQFEKAQDTLKEMLACNAAMKTIRMEYERYLEESTPRWQQQLKEKTEAAQRKRMEYVRSCLNNTEQEQMTKSSADPSLSQGLAKEPQKVSAPQENNKNSHYSQGVSSYLPYVQSSWLTHPPSQTARFPIRVPSQPQGSSHVPPSCLPPPSIFPHPHQFQLFQQLASSSSHHYTWPRHDLPGWASPHPNYPWPWPTGAAGIPSGCGAPWGQLYMEEPPHHERGADVETSRASSSKRERSGGSRSSHLSQELDIKPVRLSNGHAESSESGRDSSQVSREKTKKKEKRGKTQQTSSDRDGSSSHESSVTSSAIVIAGVAVAQSSESDTSSEQCSTGSSKRTRTRSGGFTAGLPRMEDVANGRSRRTGGDPGSHNEESESTSEEPVNQISRSRSENEMKGSPDDKLHSCGEEESKSVSAEAENRDADIENQERSTGAEESNDEEKNEEEGLEDIGEVDDDHDDEEKENSQRNDEQEEINVEEELEDDGDDEDDNLKDEDGENGTQGSASASSEDEEEESEEDENKMGDDKEESAEEEDREGEEEEEEEEQRSNEVEEEERDSEDSIISPQETR
ncbi:hypothetical protein INR49_024504 [Caranx melampygus]|nr:hypothetical protein INR49_024504 [Caranx melampygus]